MAQVNKGGNIRTDLAVEANALWREQGTARDASGVRVEETKKGSCTITRVKVQNEQAAREMGKPVGNYITIDSPALLEGNRQEQEEVAHCLAEELKPFVAAGESVLVVGLGNWKATPDALGPKVADMILVTRHLGDYVPPEVKGKLRPVSAVAPGVLGLTGIETGEIIKGIVDRVHPDVVVAVDALAARSVERIARTIQISDTGINPGSGVGQDRMGLSRKNVGVKTIAVGIPTVVHAFTIARDTVDLLLRDLEAKAPVAKTLGDLDDEEKNKLIQRVLSPSVGNLMVTPKEIDLLVEDLSRVVAMGLNAALQPGIDMGEIADYL